MNYSLRERLRLTSHMMNYSLRERAEMVILELVRENRRADDSTFRSVVSRMMSGILAQGTDVVEAAPCADGAILFREDAEILELVRDNRRADDSTFDLAVHRRMSDVFSTQRRLSAAQREVLERRRFGHAVERARAEVRREK